MQTTKTISSSDKKKALTSQTDLHSHFPTPLYTSNSPPLELFAWESYVQAYLTESCHPRREQSTLLRMLGFL